MYRNIEQNPEATIVPGILIVRVDSAIYFSNSNYVRKRYLLTTSMTKREFKLMAC